MKVCKSCGYENKDDAKYCAQCGTKLEPSKKYLCPNCHNYVLRNEKHCTNCGIELNWLSDELLLTTPIIVKNSEKEINKSNIEKTIY